MSTRAQPCTPPQSLALRRERKAFTEHGSRPTPAADRRQRLRPRIPQPARRRHRGKGAAPVAAHLLLSRLLSALKGSQAESPSNQPAKMKKLQGAQLSKVGHEGRLGEHLREGCKGPPPWRPREGRGEHLDPTESSGVGQAELDCREVQGHSLCHPTPPHTSLGVKM